MCALDSKGMLQCHGMSACPISHLLFGHEPLHSYHSICSRIKGMRDASQSCLFTEAMGIRVWESDLNSALYPSEYLQLAGPVDKCVSMGGMQPDIQDPAFC